MTSTDPFDEELTELEAVEAALDQWDTAGPLCREALAAYVSGRDRSEQTEQRLFVIAHMLGEKQDEAAFPVLCQLLHDRERADLVFGDDAMSMSIPPILISTFDGDAQRLFALVEDAGIDEMLRGDVLMVLAYLVRTQRVAESALYGFLAALPARLQPREPVFVWSGWARAVSALGFAGLSGQAEELFRAGLIDPDLMTLADFWQDLRDAAEDPGGMSGPSWLAIGPMDSAVDALEMLQAVQSDEEPEYEAPEPARNPLRNVGRNDPCPCGSGKKYKKCCLAA